MFARAVHNVLREGRRDYAAFLTFAFSPDANASIEPGSLNPARITFPDEKIGVGVAHPLRRGLLAHAAVEPCRGDPVQAHPAIIIISRRP